MRDAVLAVDDVAAGVGGPWGRRQGWGLAWDRVRDLEGWTTVGGTRAEPVGAWPGLPGWGYSVGRGRGLEAYLGLRGLGQGFRGGTRSSGRGYSVERRQGSPGVARASGAGPRPRYGKDFRGAERLSIQEWDLGWAQAWDAGWCGGVAWALGWGNKYEGGVSASGSPQGFMEEVRS